MAVETALWVSAAIAGASAGYSAYTSHQQGKSQEAAADYNAKVAAQEATRQEQIARLEQRELIEEKRRFVSRQVAVYGKQGVQLKGTPLRVMAGTARTFAREQQMAVYNRQVSAAGYRSEANLYKFQGKAAKRAGYLGVGQSLIGGASQVSQMYLQYKMATA